jgi:hypothetical protein
MRMGVGCQSPGPPPEERIAPNPPAVTREFLLTASGYFCSISGRPTWFSCYSFLNGTDPEFTPEEAREAVAVSHLAYLAAKKGSVATMAELKDLVATRGPGPCSRGWRKCP